MNINFLIIQWHFSVPMEGCEKCYFQYGKIYLNNRNLNNETLSLVIRAAMKVVSIKGKIHTS